MPRARREVASYAGKRLPPIWQRCPLRTPWRVESSTRCDALDKSPHVDDTWIVLWSDHGWSLGEKEHWGNHVPWRESVRMPLLIVPPPKSLAVYSTHVTTERDVLTLYLSPDSRPNEDLTEFTP